MTGFDRLKAVVLVLAFGWSAEAEAQRAGSPFAAIRGYVYDSLLTRATVPGAQVFLQGPTPRVVTADARGRYLADSLQPGSYTITFGHPSFDIVGFVPEERVIELKAGVFTQLMLTTPAGHAIYARLCPKTTADQAGVVLGQLVDVRTNRPISGGEIRVEWSESLISRELGVSRRLRSAHSPTDSLGRYLVCGVPNDVGVLLRARVNAVDGPPLELDLEGRPVAIRTLTVQVTDTAAAPTATPTRGASVLRGRVRGNDGAPIVEAQVLVLGLEGGARSNQAGSFELGELPAGTHTAEIRAIGFARRRALVNLHPDQPAEIDVKLTKVAVILPELEVKAAARLAEFDERRLRGAGHFITQEAIERRNPLRTEDLFRGIPGFSVVPSGGFDYQIVSTRGVGMSGGQCAPEFFIDGAKVIVDPQIGGGLPVNPAEIYGIETYSGPATVPAQFQSQNGCGTVVIWTRRGGSRRR